MSWRITYDARTAFVEGPKAEARRRLAACGDSSAIWTSRRSAWATSPAVANRLLGQLEARNVSVVVVDTAQVSLDLSATQPANTLCEQGSLW